MEDYQKEERLLVASIASAVSKSILYISVCITFALLFSKCAIDHEAIVQCEDSCDSSRGIKEVTAWSCECGEKEAILETPWVIQR